MEKLDSATNREGILCEYNTGRRKVTVWIIESGKDEHYCPEVNAFKLSIINIVTFEVIFGSCLSSGPKVSHVKESLTNSSIKGIKSTPMCKDSPMPNTCQDQTRRLYRNVEEQQDHQLPYLLRWKWMSPISLVTPDLFRNRKNGALPSDEKHLIFWGRREKK